MKIHETGAGSFSPTLLHLRRRIDRALRTVTVEAHVNGVHTCEVDDLVEASGVDSGISTSQVSRICADLDTGSRRSGPARWTRILWRCWADGVHTTQPNTPAVTFELTQDGTVTAPD